MTTSSRRPARNQALPQQEVDLLHALAQQEDLDPLFTRTALLYENGWTLRAIGEACQPKKQRSTIRTWVQKAKPPTPASDPAYTPETLPVPILATPETYTPTRIPSPGISTADRERIKELAPVARKYRATMHPNHAAAVANREFTEIATRLHEDHVSVQELADAASVTYRAMARRLGKVTPT